MNMKTLKERIEVYGLSNVISFLHSNPDQNIPKILEWVEKFDKEKIVEKQLEVFKGVLADKENNWYKLTKSMWTDIDDNVRKKVFENFFINSVIIGGKKQEKAKKENNCNIPWAILMDPTSACNLKCVGCWAADYGNNMNMDFETLDNIIEQGKALGTYMYIFSGGEPLVRKNDIIKLCEKHNDCMFLAFTNATLIDESFADEMLRIKNFIPAISVEGFENETDIRRGKGTYNAIIKAMDTLKNKKLPFGISCCYTRQNTEIIGSEQYFDDMIAKGAKFAWFFTYIPVGTDAAEELIATADQREYMYNQVRKFRNSKPIFTMDFWNDGEYVNGCIAGGKCYLHINANGDIEPCAFIHYSDSNIHEKTLLEAYKSPLFMQYTENQPFNENHLRPCPLLDNPEKLENIVIASAAKSTDMKHPEDVHNLCKKCKRTSENWAVTAERLWKNNH